MFVYASFEKEVLGNTELCEFQGDREAIRLEHQDITEMWVPSTRNIFDVKSSKEKNSVGKVCQKLEHFTVW